MTTKKLRPRAGNGKGATFEEARALARARKKVRAMSEVRAAMAELGEHSAPLEVDRLLAIFERVCREHAAMCDAADPLLGEIGSMVARGRRGLHRRAMVAMHEHAAEVCELLRDPEVRPSLSSKVGAIRLVVALMVSGVPMKCPSFAEACNALEGELEERAARDRVPDVDRLVALALEACGWSPQDAEVLSRSVPLTPPRPLKPL